jgi:hypothetical protein
MSIRLISSDAHVLNVRTRFPFRYGIATLTACPHLFLRVELDVDGEKATGVAADHLPPKWFTKNPQTPYRDDLGDMTRVIRHARDTAQSQPPAETLFAFWRRLYDAQSDWARRNNVPPLLAHFGTSLVERAAIDAFCRAKNLSFGRALRDKSNPFGVEGVPVELLLGEPLRDVICRHTVGLSDPITDADIPPGERLDDGLPQSLEQCIAAYGLTHFKIKLSGDVAKDGARLRQLARALAERSPNYAFTLDGNENFHHIEPLRKLWDGLTSDQELAPFLKRLVFLEQPLHRDIALSDDVRASMRAWHDRPPIIIDESDATLDSLPRAIDCGYAGTSHKNCKGIFKGVINACRIARLRSDQPGQTFLLSGEDLSNIGPVSLPQDLAVMATLGVTHVERNGQHYFHGLSYLPADQQATCVAAQPDLYRRDPRGFATLDIKDGKIRVGSCVDAPFGVPFTFDPSRFTPLESWPFDSL